MIQKRDLNDRVLRDKMTERTEVLMRIVVGVVTGIILSVWRLLIYVFVLINVVYTLFSGKRHKEIAEMSEIWNTQVYIFIRYMTFVTNQRPFPFENMTKNLSKFNKK